MIKKYIAESLGTFLLVLFGCGAIVFNQQIPGNIGHFGIAASFGAIVYLMIILFGKASGAHINPAVTLTFLLKKEISFKDSILYISLQIIGALLASLSLKLLFPDSISLGETIPQLSILKVFILEFMLTFLLIIVILRQYKTQSLERLAFMVGLTVFIEALVFGPLTGASMNPARSIGPAIISGNTQALWLYIAAPCLAGIMAFSIDKFYSIEQNENK